MADASTDPGTLTPRGRRSSGVVAVVERDSATVCELALEDGIEIRRSALGRNDADGYSWKVEDPDAVAAVLERLLERAGLPRRVDALAPSQSLFGVTCTAIPPVKGETRAAVLGKRLREIVSDSEGEWLVDTTPIGNPGDEEAISVPSVAAWADRAAVERLAAAARERGIDVRRIVPPMVGLLNLLGHTRTKGAKGALLVVHVSLPSLCIFLFDGEDLLYVRPLRDALATEPEQLPEVVLTEVQRTVAYFRENQGGRGVDQVLVSGLARESAERFSRWLAGSTGVPAHPLSVADAAGTDGDALAAHVPVLAGLLLRGMRAHLARSPAMNLLPSRPRLLPRVAAAAALAVASVTAAAWARESFSLRARALERRVESIEEQVSLLEAAGPRRARALEEARRFEAEKEALAAVEAGESGAVQPLLEATLLVPAGLTLVGTRHSRPRLSVRASRFDEEGARLELRLRGDFTGGGPALVERFLKGLRARTWCAAAAAEVASPSGGEFGEEDEVRVEVALR